jgi:hypothetical protein
VSTLRHAAIRWRILAASVAALVPAGLLAAGVVSPATATTASAPAASGRITGGVFGVPTKYSQGSGDTWYNTWANDGNIYATSNDTHGFNGTCDSDIAINELAGSDPTQLTEPYINCMTSFGHIADVSQDPDDCSWKSGGIISVSGTLYLAVARQGWTGACKDESNGEQPSLDASIVKSTDDGRTWSNGFGATDDPGGAAPQWDAAAGRVQAMFPGQGFSAPFFINYGQDDNPASTADGGDQYVYAVSNDGYAYDGNYLILGRVLRSQIGDLNAADWQFYSGPVGGDGMNSADWSSDLSQATHILTAAHQLSQPDIQYYPSLHEYVLASFYYPWTSSWPSNGSAHSSTFSFYEAPHPWGPWIQFLNKPTTMTVCYIDCQPQNTMPLGLYDPAPVSKFARMEGLSNIIFTSGDFTSATRYDDPELYMLHTLPLTLTSRDYHITDDSSPAITYTGSWSSSTFQSFGVTDYFDGSESSSSTPGASASFTFTGPTIEWIGSTNDNQGYASVSIDGGTPTTVDTYSPTSDDQVTLFKSTGLSPGKHTITITVTSQKDSASSNTWQDIDAFITATP